MPLDVTNKAGEKTPFKVTTFADYLKSVGVPAEEARALATSLSGVAADLGIDHIDTDSLRRIGHQLADVGSARLALEKLIRGDAVPTAVTIPAVPPKAAVPFRHPLFAVPMLPLVDQGLFIQKVNPQLAALVADLPTLARAPAEETVARDSQPLLTALAEAGISDSYLGAIGQMLKRDHVPVAPRAPAQQVAKRLEVLANTPGFSSGNQPGEAVLQAALFAANGEVVADGGQLVPAPPPDGTSPYVVVASVDLPRIVSGNTYAAVSRIRASMFGGDDLRATEVTYQNDLMESLTKDNVPENAPIVPPGYRPTINQKLPNGWFENVQPGIKVHLFQFVLTEQNLTPFAETLQRLLQDNKARIQEEIDKLADAAGDAAKGAATAYGAGFLSDLAEKLAKQVVKLGLKQLYTLVLELLGGHTFTTATITHLVNWQPGRVPESTFRLDVAGGDEVLLYPIERDPIHPFSSTILEENGKPKYAPGGPPVSFLRTSRFMRGTSKDPAMPAPADLWRKIGAIRQAAVWASTEANEGFHVLTSITETGGSGLYVWGLRADVWPTGVAPHGVSF